jgi:hypothetical protein
MSEKTSGWGAFRDSANIDDLTMITYESHEQYEELLRALYEEFTPHGIMEDNQVLRLAKMIWSRNRTDRYVQLKMYDKQLKLRFTNEFSHIRADCRRQGRPSRYLLSAPRISAFR